MNAPNQIQATTLTLVLSGGCGERLDPLTSFRPKATVAFGGVHRIMDFTLSNILNSQLRRVYVLTGNGSDGVHAYIREGWAQLSKEFCWDRGEDLVCIPPASGKRYRGTADAILQNIELIEHSRAEYVLVLVSDLLYRMDYGEVLRHHAAGGKDVTIVTGEKSDAPIGVYVFTRDALVDAMKEHAGSAKIMDLDRVVARMRGKGSELHRFHGYVRDIDTVDDYYKASMDVLPGSSLFDPYGSEGAWPIRTLNGVPLLEASRYASNSRVALAARIKGSRVVNSVVSFAARVNVDAQVENSVILNGAEIGRGARIRNAVVAENAVVPPYAEIGFDDAADQEKFRITPNGIVIVDSHEGAKQPYEQRRAARVATRQSVR